MARRDEHLWSDVLFVSVLITAFLILNFIAGGLLMMARIITWQNLMADAIENWWILILLEIMIISATIQAALVVPDPRAKRRRR
jgi:hypothetical protein